LKQLKPNNKNLKKNKDKKNNTWNKDKKRTNWNQSLRSTTKTAKAKKIKKSLQYLLLLKKFNNNIDYKKIKLLIARMEIYFICKIFFLKVVKKFSHGF